MLDSLENCPFSTYTPPPSFPDVLLLIVELMIVTSPKAELIAPPFADAPVVEFALWFEDTRLTLVFTDAAGAVTALRYEEESIRAGVRGCLNVLRYLGMLPAARSRAASARWEPVVARSSQWVRAEQDGVFRPHVRLGARVRKDDVLGIVGSPMGEDEVEVVAPAAGVVVGCNNIPLVNEGEALFHIARFDALGEVARGVEEFVTDIQIAAGADDGGAVSSS